MLVILGDKVDLANCGSIIFDQCILDKLSQYIHGID